MSEDLDRLLELEFEQFKVDAYLRKSLTKSEQNERIFLSKKIEKELADTEKYYQLVVYQKDHYKECEKFKQIIEKLNKSKEAIEKEIKFFDSRNPPQSHVHQDMFLKII